MTKYLSFENMLTPKIIVVVHAVSVLASILSAIWFVVVLTAAGIFANNPTAGGMVAALATDLVILLSGCVFVPLGLRLFFEALILAFRMNDSLTEIARHTK